MRKNSALKMPFLLFLIFIQFGCSLNQSNSGKTNLPVKPLKIIGEGDESYGADIRLSITEVSENDTSKLYKAVSDYKGQYLGLTVCIPKQAEDNKGFGKAIVLKSIGPESDNLLELLTALYKLKPDPNAKFISSVSTTYVNISEFAKSLGGNTPQEDLNKIDYKLFFDLKDDEAELFLNINLKEHWLELSEKDTEYRPLVIKALSK